MTRRLQLTLLVTLLLGTTSALAETSYVIDKLLVGVHADKNLDSAIIKVLPTGTRLEVIERDGELALIEDPEQVRGWVDSAYLTVEVPAALRLAELQRDKDKLEKQLAEAASATPATADAGGAGSAEIEALTKENTELKGKLSEQRLRAGKLQTEIAAVRAEMQNNAAPPDARIVELERDRDALNGKLEDAEDQIAELSARASLKATSDLVPLVLKEYASAIAIIVLVIMVFAFGAGIYVVDLLNRRRHGGFRV